jgi:transketolase
MARGDLLSGAAFDPNENPEGRRVVALVGDASIVNGVAMEGLNNAGTLKRQFLVVLNDNGMSIASSNICWSACVIVETSVGTITVIRWPCEPPWRRSCHTP